ncbi:copper resistance protein CopC/CopD [Streptomyces sp. ISL-22]|uniref:copper resistance CopC/CopD family protein n=1 Tax=unclassified Streptomyces TaxID=2593676 RepID=UPI001BECC16F|nr:MULTISPECIES: copper resistance protein CopC [unclassified Streptomyces]MBT2421926.1 copper resistance protein CopC/CopD [Streptomyces sp. ISL-24]MBT2433476.1 copper resistance protein CopC/CopD [Streptomyces sp. ISL-22]
MLLGPMLVLLLLGGTVPASAHAALRATDPEDGSLLKSAPRHLTLTFTESVGLLDDSFRVLDPDGRRLRTGEPQHGRGGGDTARVTLPAKLAQGTYTVAWRVVSADSHPVSGAFTFSVGKRSLTTATVDTGPTEDPATKGLYNIARYLAYLAAALLIGTATFMAVCRPPDTPVLARLLRAGWWTLLAATLALLVLRAPYETGEGPLGSLGVDSLTRTLTSRPGAVLLARLALLLVTAVHLVRLSRRRQPPGWAGAALAVGLALTWAAGEHASAGIQVPAAMTSSALHLLATAVWLGGLTALLGTLYRAHPTPATVTRFSRLAFASVTVLVVTGVYQSWRGLGSWDALTGTTYGRLLLLKLAAVALLLGAAAVSRRWTARLATVDAGTVVREKVPEPVGGPPLPEAAKAAASADDDHAPHPAVRRALRRSVLAEVAVGAAVLAVTTVLTSTLPGRAQAEAAAGAPAVVGASVTTVPFDVGTPGGRGKVQITLDPGRVGDNSVEALVYGPDGGIAIVPELRLSFTLRDRQIGPLDAQLADKGGYWGNSFVNLPVAGTWEMKVTVRTSEIDQVSVTRSVTVR